MTNSEKIKAYLDAGHKVEIEMIKGISYQIVYGYDDEGFITKYGTVGFDFYDDFSFSIHQEPLRYPKVGDKVVVLDTCRLPGVMHKREKGWDNIGVVSTYGGPYCEVIIDGITRQDIDYRHLAPYIE